MPRVCPACRVDMWYSTRTKKWTCPRCQVRVDKEETFRSP